MSTQGPVLRGCKSFKDGRSSGFFFFFSHQKKKEVDF